MLNTADVVVCIALNDNVQKVNVYTKWQTLYRYIVVASTIDR